MAPKIVLITGTNRGIGKGLLEKYLQKPNHTIIAANRDPNHPTSKALLTDLPRAEGTTLLVLQLDASVPDHPARAVRELQATHHIDHVDTVIANAAIAADFPLVRDVRIEDMQKHTEVNVYAVVRLFQAVLPLLQRSEDPKWVSIGSSVAYLTNPAPAIKGNACYGQTKAALHWITKAISIEETWLNAFPIDPGWVQTDMGNSGAVAAGYEKAFLTIDESTSGLFEVIEAATKETHSGKLWTWEGKEVPW